MIIVPLALSLSLSHLTLPFNCFSLVSHLLSPVRGLVVKQNLANKNLSNILPVMKMIYLQILSSVIITLFSFAASDRTNCQNCPDLRYIHHYKARGCSPVSRSDCLDCVERFECPTIQKESNKCYYGGETYELDQDIRVPNPCNRCHCSGRAATPAEIVCVSVECPEIFSPPDVDVINKTCYYSYKPGRCCGEKRCPRLESPESKPLATCSYEGKVYKEGQQIDLPDCYTCTCTPEFNSSTVKSNPACHQHTCFFNTKMLEDGCLPVYLPSGCCYTQLHCPSPNLAQRRQDCQQFHSFGFCDQNVTRYHFNSSTNQCYPFSYSGCGGSVNTFTTQEECLNYCTAADPVRPAPIPGKCYFDGVNYDIGSKLTTEPAFDCTCSIPPDFTCIFNLQRSGSSAPDKTN